MASGLLKPMGPDSLLKRPAPQAAASGAKPALALRAALEEEKHLKPASFEAPEAELDLLAGFVIEDEPDEDDDEPDFLDSAAMPYPACVPAYDIGETKPRRRIWLIAALAVLAVTLAAIFLILK